MRNSTTELLNAKIYIAGHRGMVGSAVCRRLGSIGCQNLVVRDSRQLDLRDQSAVHEFFACERPEVVVFCAAKVGGIHANNAYPAEFIYDNLMMAANAVHAAYINRARRFLFLGSTCIYPRETAQPIQESALLTSPLEKTNEAYAIAKISGLKMCEFYRRQYGVMFHSAMPTNLYGPGDNYHPENSHVLPAMIRRFHEAVQQRLPEVVIWGTGKPRRDLLHVDDLAAAIELLLTVENPPDWVNVGSGVDVSIRELADTVAEIVGFKGEIKHDLSKPDGTMLKLADISTIRGLGWQPQISLRRGIEDTYRDFCNSYRSGSSGERTHELSGNPLENAIDSPGSKQRIMPGQQKSCA
ncbi:MAG TPA: GDP-L-fucose synthase [Pirellulaceae bacterium]|nr:GDP-L-fucose synthase [Pirellulaceae bacterium]HMO92504.1 GDP-L-fucose synthase [Pirellulaceae bacterium]HMP69013.1 GDP-L-fucose synthase [Pirellulaceae bacterium]